MVETKLKKQKGIYDLINATELENLAYKFYINDVYEDGSMDTIYYTQKGFIGSIGCEQYFEKANQILRDLKIKRIRSEII